MSFEDDQGIRINKYLADSGKCSRRQADRLIKDGQVFINGRVAELGDKVLPGMKVTLNGENVSSKNVKRKYIMLNKPVGVICTADPGEPANVVSFIDHDDRIYPIGRLDKDSEGLLLLTNDGDIVNKILRASEKHEKEYEVRVDKTVDYAFIKKMESGVDILGTTTLPCKLVKTGEKTFNITLTQGLNRQIRRMCEALGYEVKALRRVRIMHLRLGNLKLGKWRNMTPAELNELFRQIGK